MTTIKEIVDCLFDENHMLNCDHTVIVELQTFAKQILVKFPNFELLPPLGGFIKKCTKLVPLVEFVDGLGLWVGEDLIITFIKSMFCLLLFICILYSYVYIYMLENTFAV